jgi:hypothetical protein
MNEQPLEGGATTQTPEPRRRGTHRSIVMGAALIAFGVLALIANFAQSSLLGLLILPAIGVIFVVWGILVRQVGLLIPGGILLGIGVGALLSQEVFVGLSDTQQGGVVTLSMGVGFLLIIPLALMFTRARVWWPVFPGVILALIGVALLIGGQALTVLEIAGRFWPVLLIAIGVYFVYRASRRRS